MSANYTELNNLSTTFDVDSLDDCLEMPPQSQPRAKHNLAFRIGQFAVDNLFGGYEYLDETKDRYRNYVAFLCLIFFIVTEVVLAFLGISVFVYVIVLSTRYTLSFHLVVANFAFFVCTFMAFVLISILYLRFLQICCSKKCF